MANTPLGNMFAGLNRALDSRAAKAIGLRRLLERATYSSVYHGVKLAGRTSKAFGSSGKQQKAERLETAPRKDLFDLNYSEEQEMVRGAIQDFVAQQIRPQAEHCSETGQVTDEIRKGFAELGLAYYAVPEALGGMQSERSTVTQMAMAETLAYGDLGVALALLTPIGALNALVRWGSAAQQEKYIPGFLEEGSQLVASIAVDEPEPLFDPFQLRATAGRSGSGYTLSGTKSLVPLGGEASFFLVAASLEDGSPAVFIVESGVKGLTIATDRGMGLRPAQTARLELREVEVDADALLVQGDDYAEFINLARLGWCALAVGTCQAALDYVIEYGNNREAFGEPITHRQSVAFMIANIRIEVDGMRVLTQRAVSRAEQGLDFHREAYLASIQCAEKAMEIGTNAVQLLGGYGFCRDYPVERWYRDLRAVAVSYNGMHL